jgi:ABC-type phosphate transport system substrate-binding protein
MLRSILPLLSVCISLLAWGLSSMPAYADDVPVIAVIVSNNADIAPVSSLAPNELRLIYWRKKEYWQGGQRMQPANLHAEHPLRLLFSKVVLSNLPKAQTDYWNELYFHGIRPPRSVQSEEAMIRYVADTKGSIGYVDACHLDSRVQSILWIVQGQITAEAPDHLSCK